MNVWVRIFSHELAYQTRTKTFWVAMVSLGFIGLLLTANAVEFQLHSAGGVVKANSPYLISEFASKIPLLMIFLLPAVFSTALLRESSHQFSQIYFSLPITKHQFLGGRAVASLVIILLLGAVPLLAHYLGGFWPWTDSNLFNPLEIWPYVYAYCIFLAPTLVIISGALIAITIFSKSSFYSYLVLILILGCYLSVKLFNWIPEWFDPFLLDTIGDQTKYWSAVDKNSRFIEIGTLIAVNRGVWFSISFGLVCFAWWKLNLNYSTTRNPSKDTDENLPPVFKGLFQVSDSNWHKMGHQLQRDIRRSIYSVPFLFILILSAVFLTMSLLSREVLYGLDALPTARVLAASLSALTLPTLVLALVISGDLIWGDQKMDQIIGSLPVPNWIPFLSKCLVLAIALLSIQLLGLVAVSAVYYSSELTSFDFPRLVFDMLVMDFVSLLVMGCLMLVLQVLAPNRFMGMLYFGVFFGLIVMSRDLMGIEHPLLSYGIPQVHAPWSDFNPWSFLSFPMSLRVYWLGICLAVLVVGQVYWRRSLVGGRQLARLNLSHKIQLGLASALVASTGVYIAYNIHWINPYVVESEINALRAEYERKFALYQTLPMPRTQRMDLEVDLHLDERLILIQGQQYLENKSETPIYEVHLVFPPCNTVTSLKIGDRDFEKPHDDFNYFKVDLSRPAEPGETVVVDFKMSYQREGFPHQEPNTRLVENGLFIQSNRLSAHVGYDPNYQLEDNRVRKQLGLVELSERPSLEDRSQWNNHVIRQDSDFIDYQMTISTETGQQVVAPGKLVGVYESGGRIFSQFQTRKLIKNLFAIQAGEYEVLSDQWRDVDLEVYFHPKHGYNVNELMLALKDSVALFSQEFSPYPFNVLRIVELPGYQKIAQSFPTTIAFSEDFGFLADLSSSELNMPYFITAHEVAHQWWGHMVAAANVEGDGFIHESLAQYFALFALEKKYGKHQVKLFLDYELDRYLTGRANDTIGELPLYRVQDQDYLQYRKGSLVMYALKEYLGEAVLHKAIRNLLALRSFSTEPYGVSIEFVQVLKDVAPKSQHQYIDDLLLKVSHFEMEVVDLKTTSLPEGNFRVSGKIQGRQNLNGGNGPIPNYPLELVFYSAEPIEGEINSQRVVKEKEIFFRNGVAEFSFVADEKPNWVWLDPFHRLLGLEPESRIVAM